MIRLNWLNFMLMALALASPSVVVAQDGATNHYGLSSAWTFNDLAQIEGVDTADIATLRQALEEDARQAVRLVTGLGAPSSAQIISSFLHFDGAALDSETDKIAKSFAVRPKDGVAGIVQVAALAVRAKQGFAKSVLSTPFKSLTHNHLV